MNGPAPWWWAPALTAALTLIGAWIAIRFDRRKVINQELIRKRIALYDLVAPQANDLLCYFCRFGAWQGLTPDHLVAHKRELDRLMNIYGPLFSTTVTSRYRAFICVCFQEHTGSGEAAKIRADMEGLKREFGTRWDMDWDHAFAVPEEQAESRVVRAAYDDFLQALAHEIGGNRVRRAG